MEDRSEEHLHQRPALRPKRLAELDMKVRLVHDDEPEGLLARGVEDDGESVWVIDEELGGEEHKVHVPE